MWYIKLTLKLKTLKGNPLIYTSKTQSSGIFSQNIFNMINLIVNLIGLFYSYYWYILWYWRDTPWMFPETINRGVKTHHIRGWCHPMGLGSTLKRRKGRKETELHSSSLSLLLPVHKMWHSFPVQCVSSNHEPE